MHIVDEYPRVLADKPNSKTLQARKEQLERRLEESFDPAAMDELEDVLCYRGWKRTDARTSDDFAHDESGMREMHYERRSYLRKHRMYPLMQRLEGHDWSTMAIACTASAVNLLLAYLWGRGDISAHPALFALSVGVVGSSVCAMMGVVIHDAGHNLVSPADWVNKACLLVANLPLVFPLSFSFKRYHFLHHVYQGVEGKDPDLPLRWEIPLISGKWYAKLAWIAIYPFMYLVRGMAQQRKPSAWELRNWTFMLVVDLAVFFVCGWQGLAFLAASMWFGYSFHPAAAHFIQEHYTFLDGQETYSYYGPLNPFFLNIGFHNEHHDLMAVPWRRLPFLRELVPSMYKRLNHHTSWFRVHWDFVTTPYLGPCSRIVRPDTRSGPRLKEE